MGLDFVAPARSYPIQGRGPFFPDFPPYPLDFPGNTVRECPVIPGKDRRTMAPSIGVNLRVTGHCNQGGRKYMEDVFSVAYQQTEDEKDLEYAFFGIFDGHGGREAAQFAKDNLMEHITKNSKFWSDDDQTVLKAIREGFLETQKAMWADLPNWRKTASGLPSTAGTTASICF